MVSLLSKTEAADLIVYAFPLYIYSTPGIVKNYLDRLIPLIKPELIEENNLTAHPFRNPDLKRKIFLICVAGFPEKSHFDPLVSTFEKTYRTENNKLIGKILISGSEPMSRKELQSAFTELYSLIEDAGFEVGKYGSMSAETEQAIIKNVNRTPEGITEFRKIANSYWNTFKPISSNKIVIDKTHKELTLNDGGIKTLFAGMAAQYNPDILPDFEGAIQFVLDTE